MTSFPIFESIEINPNLAINHRFWLLLREKFEKIRSDSESSCNFTSTCTKPKIENQLFLWFRARYFQKIWLKRRSILGTFLTKSLFRPIFATICKKGTIGKYRWFLVGWPTISEATGYKTSNGGVLDLSFDFIIAGPI